ncbi:J domain-containing protein [Qipengyuania atrilutea]|uniref:DnaJ domain-containing protein n=1 Tax=Qipengyuania atrilutea TaxID=2744473 RepID=A0A850H2Q1_9SPHN|nr:J domain-containing protein [Actirhodobacter atriluteus]NVD44178.1 DnaJ domain-containing protein [Actirhodobacter atriluteus]
MNSESDFVDYYDTLKADFYADARTLEIAYHFYAKMFHPDNAATADVDKFGEIVAAYEVLRDADRRADYDLKYIEVFGRPPDPDAPEAEFFVDQETASRDDEIHAEILFALYKRRRAKASDPGVIGWILQEKLGCTEDQFEFYVWYLRSKGYLEVTQEGSLAITILGVEHVIAMSRESVKEKLLLSHAANQSDGAGAMPRA